MYELSGSTQAALDYNSTIIGALELSEKKWVLSVQLPGVSRYSQHVEIGVVAPEDAGRRILDLLTIASVAQQTFSDRFLDLVERDGPLEQPHGDDHQTIIIGLAGRSIRSQVVSTGDIRSLWVISSSEAVPHFALGTPSRIVRR
jgi:hypothetical protein